MHQDMRDVRCDTQLFAQAKNTHIDPPPIALDVRLINNPCWQCQSRNITVISRHIISNVYEHRGVFSFLHNSEPRHALSCGHVSINERLLCKQLLHLRPFPWLDSLE